MNWKLGVVYFCPEDPRMIVRTLLPVGWAWNFANPKVIVVLPLVVFVFLLPPYIAYRLGVTSNIGIASVLLVCLSAIVAWADHCSKDPLQ